MEKHGRLTILHQSHIKIQTSFAVVVLKEPNTCYRCRKIIDKGMIVRRQLLYPLIRYYHVECQMMGAHENRRKQSRSHIDAEALEQMLIRC